MARPGVNAGSNPGVIVSEFDDREAASIAVASELESLLRGALAKDNEATDTTLIVSGGSTPKACFEHLSKAAIEWCRVQVTLTDERSVDVSDSNSNERMVRTELLRNAALDAKFHPLEDEIIDRLNLSNSVALVGMGEDGHFASIFPEMANCAAALNLENPVALMPAQAPSAPKERITMTLSHLTQAQSILLLVFGRAKLAKIHAPSKLPIEALLQQNRSPVHIYWAP